MQYRLVLSGGDARLHGRWTKTGSGVSEMADRVRALAPTWLL